MIAHTGECRVTARMPSVPESVLLRRVRGEYNEMPSLQLSVEQAMRLWSLDHLTCARVLDTLAQTGFLQLDDRGRYVRTHGGY